MNQSKEEFIKEVTGRFKQLAIDVIALMERSKSTPALKVIRYQLLKSVTSSSANYRAACRARSKREFFAKMSIVVEEIDETEHWLELLRDSVIEIDKVEVERLRAQSDRLTAIVSTARKNTRF